MGLRMDRSEWERLRREGQVQKVHLGSIRDALAPRGTMEKNSLSKRVYDILQSKLEYWTDPEYSDSLDEDEAVLALVEQAEREVAAAISAFINDASV